LHLSESLRDDKLFATLVALGNYYLVRADLRRATQVITSLRDGLVGQQWARPVIDLLSGASAFLRGEFDGASTALETVDAAVASVQPHRVDAEWLRATEPTASTRLYLGLVALVRGDLTRTEAELTGSARLAEALDFPEGPYLRMYTRSMEAWLRVEAGQLDRAAAVASEMINESKRHGFDMWPQVGAA
jgi:hypothetical protein